MGLTTPATLLVTSVTMRTPAGYFVCGGVVMLYTKPPLSIKEQISLLISRGMVIPDHIRSSRYLSHINYYRLRAYWLPFEFVSDNGDHQFREGTNFDDVLAIYLFDRKFRLLIIEAVERVEVSFRAQFAHVLSLRYGSHPHLDASLFLKADKYQDCLNSLQKEITRSHETFIDHYRETYSEPDLPPIWASSEVMSFGLLSKWFSNLKHRQDRQAIAAIYGFDETILNSFMHHLTHVRNLAAHHSRLWNRRLTFTIRLPQRPSSLCTNFNHQSPRNIYNTLVMLGYLLKVISPGTTWKVRLRRLLHEYPQAQPSGMGFPKNWNDLPFWEVQP